MEKPSSPSSASATTSGNENDNKKGDDKKDDTRHDTNNNNKSDKEEKQDEEKPEGRPKDDADYEDPPGNNSSTRTTTTTTTNNNNNNNNNQHVVPAAAAAAIIAENHDAEEDDEEEEDFDDDYYNSTSSALTDERWEEMFERLLEFKEIHGHCLVPNRYKEDLQLGAWVSAQRKNHKLIQAGSGKSTPLTPERLQRLIDAGFEWTAKNPRHLMWEVRFSELKDFKDTYGHSQVPIGWEQNVQLANWVSTQRQEYKNLIKGKTSRLNDKRVRMLNSLGFAWELQRGGRRRRLTVASPPSRGYNSGPRPPHPADLENAGTPRKKIKVDHPDHDTFPIDDGSTPVRPTPAGRKRTTLKKKLTASDGSSRCILPGVAILGGGRDAPGGPRPSPGRKSGRGGSSSAAAMNRGRGADSPASDTNSIQNHQHEQQDGRGGNRGGNEAILRALGGNPHAAAASTPWQMLPNGAYQFAAANPFMAHHLMGQAGAGAFFPMAASPFGMNMNPFMGGQFGGMGGMDPRQFGQDSNGMMGAAGMGNPGNRGSADQQQQRMIPFAVQSMNPEDMSPDDGAVHQQQQYGGGMVPNQFGGNPFPQGSMGGMNMGMGGMNMGGGAQQGSPAFWGMSDNAAAAAAAQHLQAAAALTAGMDERSLPPHLAPLASVARRMNQNNSGGGGGVDASGMRGNVDARSGGGNSGVGGPGLNPGSGGGGGQGMANAQNMARSRRGDPPADPPSAGQYGGMGGQQQARKNFMAGGGPGRRMRKDIFDDADEN